MPAAVLMKTCADPEASRDRRGEPRRLLKPVIRGAVKTKEVTFASGFGRILSTRRPDRLGTHSPREVNPR
jgi:hypothetical protein